MLRSQNGAKLFMQLVENPLLMIGLGSLTDHFKSIRCGLTKLVVPQSNNAKTFNCQRMQKFPATILIREPHQIFTASQNNF